MKNRVTLCKVNAETGELTPFDDLIEAYRNANDDDRYDIFHKILSLGIFAIGEELDWATRVLVINDVFNATVKLIEGNDGMIWVRLYDGGTRWEEFNDEDLARETMDRLVDYLDENVEINLQH